jgi:CBS domain-containing protein
MMGGTMRSPLTAIVFMLELTHDVALLPGLLVACVTAHAVTVLLMRRSILTEKVARRGHHVMREYSVSPLHLQRVEEVMETDVPVIPSGLAVDGFFQRLADQDSVLGPRQDWPIVDDAGRLMGLITRGDLVRALEREGSEDETVLAAGSARLIVAYPDELLEEATAKMLEHDIGRLPVVRRDDPTRLVGFLGRAGVMAVLLQATREERVRDPGWLSARLQFLRSRVTRVLAGR